MSQALRRTIERLPEPVHSRLTLENEDKTDSPADLLPVCADTGVPLVYDVQHHRCRPDGLSIEDATVSGSSAQARAGEALFKVGGPKESRWPERKIRRLRRFVPGTGKADDPHRPVRQRRADEAHADYNFGALYYGGSGGRVEDCVIRGFQGKTHLNSQSAGLTCSNPKSLNTNVVNLEVVHNTFADDGMAMWLAGDLLANPAVLRATILVQDNTITGSGPSNPTPAESQDGMLIEPTVGGVIRNNRLSNLYSNIPDPIFRAFGILAYDRQRYLQSPILALQPLRIENNALVDVQNAIGVARGDNCQVLNNYISSGRTNTEGLRISGTNVTVNFNRFTNLTRGIVLLGNDPAVHTATGIAKKAAVTGNRFCNVETNLVIEPLVTEVTEQGTLTCPFPDPTLDIASAVFLSWPNDADGWNLESAPSALGPWTPLDAMPTVQDGRFALFVKSDGQQRFFRLRAPSFP